MNTSRIQEYFSYSGNLLGFYSCLEKWSLRKDLIGLTYSSKVYFTLSSQGSFILFIDSSSVNDVIANLVWFIAYLVWHRCKRSILFDITKLGDWVILQNWVIVSHICYNALHDQTWYDMLLYGGGLVNDILWKFLLSVFLGQQSNICDLCCVKVERYFLTFENCFQHSVHNQIVRQTHTDTALFLHVALGTENYALLNY